MLSRLSTIQSAQGKEGFCGKRQAREAHVNAISGSNCSLLHVWDSRNKVRWLVDSGSLLTIVPPSTEHLAKGPDENTLCAANGTKIACYGKTTIHIDIGNRSFYYDAVVADVKHHILGADFLSRFYLAPNLRDGNLLDLKELSTLPATLATGFSSNPVNFVNKDSSAYYKLLDKFPSISQPSFKGRVQKISYGLGDVFFLFVPLN